MSTVRVQRLNAGSEMLVSQLTLSELEAELKRRVSSLQKQRDQLLEKLAQVERDLQSVGGIAQIDASGSANGTAATARRRMRATDYEEGVAEALESGTAYTVSEICDVLIQRGYNAKKNTLQQGMLTSLIDGGLLVEAGKKGRAKLYELA